MIGSDPQPPNRSVRVRQAILILGVLVLFVLLFFADKKALVNPGGANRDQNVKENSVQANPTNKEDAAYAQFQAFAESASEKELLHYRDSVNSSNNKVFSALVASFVSEKFVSESNAALAGNALYEGALDLMNQGDSASAVQFLENAVQQYDQAIARNPEFLDYQVNKSLCLVELPGKSMEGILGLRKITESDPGNTKANYMLGVFSLRTGQYAKAENRFKTVLGKEKENCLAHLNLIKALSGQGKAAEAKVESEKMKIYCADSPEWAEALKILVTP